MAVKSVVQFLQQVKVELSKVVWPSFNEWVGTTIIVLFLVCIFAVYLGGIDLLFAKLAKYIFKLYGSGY